MLNILILQTLLLILLNNNHHHHHPSLLVMHSHSHDRGAPHEGDLAPYHQSITLLVNRSVNRSVIIIQLGTTLWEKGWWSPRRGGHHPPLSQAMHGHPDPPHASVIPHLASRCSLTGMSGKGSGGGVRQQSQRQQPRPAQSNRDGCLPSAFTFGGVWKALVGGR